MKSSNSRNVRYGFFPRFYRSFGWVLHLAFALGAYFVFQGFFRLLVLTWVTYFMRGARFEEISEAFFPNEILSLGVGSALFIGAWRLVTPWLPKRPIVEPRPEPRGALVGEWAAGLTQGTLAAAGLLIAFLATHLYQFLGTVFRLEEAPSTLFLLLLRSVALACLAISQEWIFRGVIFGTLRARLSLVGATAAASGVYVIVQSAFFGFGWMQSISFALLSVAFCIRRDHGISLARGSAYFFSIITVPHLLGSLPVFGSEFTGVFLVKPTAQERWLTGGAAGPFSSFAFQAILATDILRLLYRRKPSLKETST